MNIIKKIFAFFRGEKLEKDFVERLGKWAKGYEKAFPKYTNQEIENELKLYEEGRKSGLDFYVTTLRITKGVHGISTQYFDSLSDNERSRLRLEADIRIFPIASRMGLIPPMEAHELKIWAEKKLKSFHER